MQAGKKVVIGTVLGLAVGLWFGVNIGRDKPFYSNPFEGGEIAQKAKTKAQDIAQGAKEKAQDVVKESKKALREQLEDEAEKAAPK